MRARPVLALTVVLALGGAASAAGAFPPPAPMADRLYLMSADTNFLYWSTDPADPELGSSSIVRTCGGAGLWGIPGHSRPCLLGISGTQRTFNIFFAPAALLEQPVTWSSASPLRFHLALNVEARGIPYTVQFVLQKNTSLVVSPDATQVSPGIWEGSLPGGSPLDPGAINFLALRVTTQAPLVDLELRGGGKSWLQLPSPVQARSVPNLLQHSTYRPEPTSYLSPTRTFTFNDADWSVRRFTGTTAGTRRFDLTLERDAVALVAWVELYDSPFVRDALMGRGLDPKKIRQGASIEVTRDAELIDHSGGGNGSLGIGTEGLAAEYVAAGQLTVEVDPLDESAENDMPFTAYVLTTHGERTLRSMRWRFMQPNSFRVPVVASCPGAYEAVPSTAEVRSIALDLDWDSQAVGLPAFTFRYSLPGVGSFPCSEAGTGDRIRFTVPGTRTWYVGATPAYDASFVAAWDTVFEALAEYTYTPAPPE